MTTTADRLTVWTHTVIDGPWPERVGLSCIVLDTSANGHAREGYPFDRRARNEILVLIKDDPHYVPDRPWFGFFSCVLDRQDVELKPWGATQ